MGRTGAGGGGRGQGHLTAPSASAQLENLSNFIKAMVSYGMNPVDLFEANDLFESGNMTQVQVSLLALAGKVRPRGGAGTSGGAVARQTRSAPWRVCGLRGEGRQWTNLSLRELNTKLHI